MKNALGLFSALLISISISACGGDPPDAARRDGTPTRGLASPAPGPSVTPQIASRLRLQALSTPEALTWTATGDLAIVDGKTGAVKQLAPTSYLGSEVDLVFDPWTSEALVFELDDDTQSGEITSYPALAGSTGFQLAPRVHRAWIDGDARLLAAPLGLVIFEASYGERWKVLFDDQHTTTSVSAPNPASAWVSGGGDQGFLVHALSYSEEGPLFRRSAAVGPHAVSSPETASLGLSPSSDPPTARLLPAPALGDAALFDIVGSDLAVRLVVGPSAGPAASIPLGQAGLRIEHVLALDGGEVALVLLSGDSRVMAVEIASDGAVKSTATLALPGVVREEKQFFSHDLEAFGSHRALAATSAGVFAIRMTRSGAGVGLVLDPTFVGQGLRGPIAALAAHSP